MFGQHRGGRPIIATIAVAMLGWLEAGSGVDAATKVVRTVEGDTCAQADSTPQSNLPAVIEACNVVVTQAEGANLGRFQRYRGRALERTGQLAGAVAAYTSALQILPNDVWSLKWRAPIRATLGDRDGAIEDYRRLDAMQPNISDWRRAITRLGGTAAPAPKSGLAEAAVPTTAPDANPTQSKPAKQAADTARPDTSKEPGTAQTNESFDSWIQDYPSPPNAAEARLSVDPKAEEERRLQEVERFELVRRVQTELTRLGYEVGEIDGIAGSRTRNALRDWLQRNGLPASREISPQLVAELEQAQPRQVAEAETKSLEPEAGDKAIPTSPVPQEPVDEPVQVVPQGPVIAATGQQARDSTAEVPHPPKPRTASPVPPRTDGEKRVALVIGNSAYQNVAALRNPRQDAEDMAAALEEIGFKVLPGYDLDRDAMDDLTTEFAREAAGADLAVAYYSGHALQYSGENLLVPVDGRLEDQYSLRRLVGLDQLIQDTGGARKLAVVIVDACRDDPLAGRQSRARSLAIPKGLAQPGYVPPRTLVAYATSPGMVAYDGSGRNSPYVSALLNHIKTPGLKVQDMFAAVTGDVARETKDAQRPGTYSSLDAEAVYLVPDASEASGIELSQLTRGEVRAIELSLSWLGFWSGDIDGEVTPALVEAMHRSQGSRSTSDVVTTAEIVALHRRAAPARGREPLPAIDNMDDLRLQATLGDTQARRLVAMVYDPAYELAGPSKNRKYARSYYESAATAGDAVAAGRLGLMLITAPGATADDQREGREWLARAANAGDPAAALRLAELLLDEGENSPARAQAVELLKAAAAKSETEGFANALLRDLGHQVVLSSNM